jgi:RND family efflux transporter MFP subunit
MKRLPVQKRTLALLAVLVPLLVLFVYVALRSGPLAPVPVTVATAQRRSLAPGLFGIGTVAARYTYKIGPTAAGRLQRLDVHVGDRVRAGQLLGAMDAVDLEARMRAQDAALNRAAAQQREAAARAEYARVQARRYQQLHAAGAASEETLVTRRQELQIAEAGLQAARQELSRLRAEREALTEQQRELQLVAPVDGLVVARNVDPGTTVVAGQAVVELLDPKSLWLDVRFDQSGAQGLAADLPARITLRSRDKTVLTGRVLRIEPLADDITEEILAKVIFTPPPPALPPIGELAEVTVNLPRLPPGVVIPNAALQRLDGQTGVWRVTDGDLRFTPVKPGPADLEGQVLIREGLAAGDRIVVYSARALTPRSSIRVVERIAGVAP